jgi:hypothetical protein
MTTTHFTEGTYTAEFLISESEQPTYSREVVTLASGQNLGPGTVLGKITASGSYTPFDQDATDGSQHAVGILYAPVDASGGATPAVAIVRDAIVHGDLLVWPADIEAGEKTAAISELATLGLLVR